MTGIEAAQAGTAALGIVPMAFIGRTSTATMQDPVESLRKQLRLSRNGCQKGSTSPATTGTWSRAGPTWTCAAAPASGSSSPPPASPATGGWPTCAPPSHPGRPRSPPSSARTSSGPGATCTTRCGWSGNCDAAGIAIFATDEPIDAPAPEAATILVRRMKQGIAEYFRYNLKAQMWEGLRQYAIAGHNTGPLPLRVRRGPHRPPQPDEGQHGRDPRPPGARPRARPLGHEDLRMAGLRETRLQQHRPAAAPAGSPAPGRQAVEPAASTTSCATPSTPAASSSGAAATSAQQAPRGTKIRPSRASTGPGLTTPTPTPPSCPWNCGKPPRSSAGSAATSATTRTSARGCAVTAAFPKEARVGRDAGGRASDAVSKAMCARVISRPAQRLKHRSATLTSAFSLDRKNAQPCVQAIAEPGGNARICVGEEGFEPSHPRIFPDFVLEYADWGEIPKLGVSCDSC